MIEDYRDLEPIPENGNDFIADVSGSALSICDLRVGNYLMRNNVLVKIDARSIFDIWDSQGFEKYGYQPIKITDNWLIKMGFIKDDRYSDLWHLKDYCDIINREINLISVYFAPKGEMFYFKDLGISNHHKHKKYIHDLQNLYYLLTGKEFVLDDR